MLCGINMVLLQNLGRLEFFFTILAPPLSFLLYPHSNAHDIIHSLPHIYPLLISLHLPSQSFQNPQSIKSMIDQEALYDVKVQVSVQSPRSKMAKRLSSRVPSGFLYVLCDRDQRKKENSVWTIHTAM